MNTPEALSIQISESFTTLSMAGFSGSLSNNNSDALSDLDVVLVHENEIPEPARRREVYEAFNGKVKWIDVDFEVSRGDGIILDGKRIDFIHMQESLVNEFIANLDDNAECDEFLPGGLLSLIPMIDKHNSFPEMKSTLQQYPENRAKKRIASFIAQEHFNIYTLQWFEKAIVRNDEFSFLKNMFESVDRFMTVIHALNRTWYSNEKRLISKLNEFKHSPVNSSARIQNLVTRHGEFQSMHCCANEIITLFNELCQVAGKVFPGLTFPYEWRMIPIA